MHLWAPKSQHLEGFMPLTFSSVWWRNVQKTVGGYGTLGVLVLTQGLVRVDVRIWKWHSRNLRSWGLFLAL